MSEKNGGGETATAIHVVGCSHHALSTDGNAAMFVLATKDAEGHDGKLALTMPAALVKFFRSTVHEVQQQVEKAGVADGSLLLNFPQQYAVGSSEQFRGAVMIVFDQGTPTERVFVLPNPTGLALAEAIRKDIMPRLTPQERDEARLLAKKHNLILPGR